MKKCFTNAQKGRGERGGGGGGTLLELTDALIFPSTAEPRFYDMARGQQNHIVKSGPRCERTPDL